MFRCSLQPKSASSQCFLHTHPRHQVHQLRLLRKASVRRSRLPDPHRLSNISQPARSPPLYLGSRRASLRCKIQWPKNQISSQSTRSVVHCLGQEERVGSDPEVGSGTNGHMAGKRPIGLLGGFISRRVDATSRRSKVIQLAQIPIVVGVILCIIGGVDLASTSSSTSNKGPTFTKIGVAIFLAAYFLLTFLLVITLRDVGEAPEGEWKLYWVLVAAVPLIGVRLLYSLIAVFGTDKKFKIVGGDPWVQFGMAAVEEFVIVCVYTATGLTLDKS